MLKFLGLLLIILIGIPVALLRGVVLVDLVDWFTPYTISVVQAVGFSFIVMLFIGHLPTRFDKKPGQEWWEPPVTTLTGSIVLSLLAWLFGWLWHFFL